MTRRQLLAALTGCAVAKDAPKPIRGRSFDVVIIDDLIDAGDVPSIFIDTMYGVTLNTVSALILAPIPTSPGSTLGFSLLERPFTP